MSGLESNFVYFHLAKDTGQIFYVGIGKGQRHIQVVGRNKHWSNYVKKHGFVAAVVIDGLSREVAAEIEVYFVRLFGRFGIDEGGILVNKSIGGEINSGWVAWNKGKKMSKQMRSKRSKYMLTSKNPMNNPESRKKIGDKMTGANNPQVKRYGFKKHTERPFGKVLKGFENPYSKPVIMSSYPKNEIINTFGNVREIVRKFKKSNFDRAAIVRVCNNKQSQHKGYKFTWAK